MIINRSGVIIRIAVSDLRVMGRATQGVRLINLKNNDSIAAVAKVSVDEEEEGVEPVAESEGTEESNSAEETNDTDNTDAK